MYVVFGYTGPLRARAPETLKNERVVEMESFQFSDWNNQKSSQLWLSIKAFLSSRYLVFIGNYNALPLPWHGVLAAMGTSFKALPASSTWGPSDLSYKKSTAVFQSGNNDTIHFWLGKNVPVCDIMPIFKAATPPIAEDVAIAAKKL